MNGIETVDRSDVLIVGAGVAGLYAALKLIERSPTVKVTIMAAAPLESGASSVWAQGGVAAAFSVDDTPESHAADTIAAGCGLNNPEAVRVLTEEASIGVLDLLRIGVPFDRDEFGAFVQGLEAAHSHRRVVRVRGDGAGRMIMRFLSEAVRKETRIRVIDPYVMFDLALSDRNEAAGVYARRIGGDAPALFASSYTIFATGGIGRLYRDTTNPFQIRGEGLGAALRAGASAADCEFVQFHPTALDIDADPCPLATEALRGEGGILLNDQGERFMLAAHPDAELAPRDVTARAVQSQISSGSRVYLDTRAALGAKIKDLFPNVTRMCLSAGIDPERDPIPIKPAQHYHCGGVKTDLYGASDLVNLYAIGETACTGAHGANRLASNSLPEALVFAARAAQKICETEGTKKASDARSVIHTDRMAAKACLPKIRELMTQHVGVLRNENGLKTALSELTDLDGRYGNAAPAANYLTAAKAVVTAALNRKTSVGGHFRTDDPINKAQ